MFEAITAAYPNLVAAMRRAHGLQPDETAALILAARFPGRAAIWTATDCRRARALIRSAFDARPRFTR